MCSPWARKVVTLALGSVGRGGDGNQGQRIRDEILSIQSRNHCKGGMMEQWHQKLHNNTSPDDVAICRALLAYLDRRAPCRPMHATPPSGPGCSQPPLPAATNAAGVLGPRC